MGGLQYLDSLALDERGDICVGTLINGGISIVSPDGSSVEHVPVPQQFWDPLVTNICFGGLDMRTAYITLSGFGHLISCQWPVPGLVLANQRR
jgi:gluconolactonase